MVAGVEVRKNILVQLNSECPSFVDDVKNDLKLIEANPIGKRLIEKIKNSVHKIYIKYLSDGRYCNPIDRLAGSTQGKGSSSILWYSLSTPATYISFQCEPIETPRFVDLFHELVHGYKYCYGRVVESRLCDQIVWSNDREYQVIMSLPSKKQNRATAKISENSFRIAQGLPPRFSHHCYGFLQNNHFIFSHIKLIARKCFSNSFSLEFSSPIKNVTNDDLESIGGAVLHTRAYLSKGSGASTILQYYPPSEDLDKMPTMMNFDPTETAFAEKLKEKCPSLIQIDSIGLYKITEIEAEWFTKRN